MKHSFLRSFVHYSFVSTGVSVQPPVNCYFIAVRQFFFFNLRHRDRIEKTPGVIEQLNIAEAAENVGGAAGRMYPLDWSCRLNESDIVLITCVGPHFTPPPRSLLIGCLKLGGAGGSTSQGHSRSSYDTDATSGATPVLRSPRKTRNDLRWTVTWLRCLFSRRWKRQSNEHSIHVVLWPVKIIHTNYSPCGIKCPQQNHTDEQKFDLSRGRPVSRGLFTKNTK